MELGEHNTAPQYAHKAEESEYKPVERCPILCGWCGSPQVRCCQCSGSASVSLEMCDHCPAQPKQTGQRTVSRHRQKLWNTRKTQGNIAKQQARHRWVGIRMDYRFV
jgi:hypothetical protein